MKRLNAEAFRRGIGWDHLINHQWYFTISTCKLQNAINYLKDDPNGSGWFLGFTTKISCPDKTFVRFEWWRANSPWGGQMMMCSWMQRLSLCVNGTSLPGGEIDGGTFFKKMWLKVKMNQYWVVLLYKYWRSYSVTEEIVKRSSDVPVQYVNDFVSMRHTPVTNLCCLSRHKSHVIWILIYSQSFSYYLRLFKTFILFQKDNINGTDKTTMTKRDSCTVTQPLYTCK